MGGLFKRACLNPPRRLHYSYCCPRTTTMWPRSSLYGVPAWRFWVGHCMHNSPKLHHFSSDLENDKQEVVCDGGVMSDHRREWCANGEFDPRGPNNVAFGWKVSVPVAHTLRHQGKHGKSPPQDLPVKSWYTYFSFWWEYFSCPLKIQLTLIGRGQIFQCWFLSALKIWGME